MGAVSESKAKEGKNMSAENKTQETIALIRVRAGTPNPKARVTLDLLKLTRVNHCVLLPSSPSVLGMISVCKDYIAWGAPNEEVIKKLYARNEMKFEKARQKANARLGGSKQAVKAQSPAAEAGKPLFKKVEKNNLFRMHPPRGGWKSVKKQYPYGSLGHLPDMNKVLLRML